MVISTQTEMKKLLAQQYATAVTKSVGSLVLASALTIGIPLYFRSVKNPVDFVVNGLGFISSSLLCVYAYVSANEIKEYGGKLKMFTELEKDRFIKEQLISQETYLNQITQQYQTVNIEPEYYHSEPSQNIDVSHHNQHSPVTELTVINEEITECSHCGSQNINKNGTIDGKQRYKCKDCNKTFGV